MRNPISINASESRAISAEIGARLRQAMRSEPEIPTRIEALLERLRAAERMPGLSD